MKKNTKSGRKHRISAAELGNAFRNLRLYDNLDDASDLDYDRRPRRSEDYDEDENFSPYDLDYMDDPSWGYDNFDQYMDDSPSEEDYSDDDDDNLLYDVNYSDDKRNSPNRLYDVNYSDDKRNSPNRLYDVNYSDDQRNSPNRLYDINSNDDDELEEYLDYLDKYDKGKINNYEMSQIQHEYANKPFWETFSPSPELIEQYGKGDKSTRWPMFEKRNGRWKPIFWRND